MTAASELIPLATARAALGVETNRTLKKLCRRFGIPIIELSYRTKGLRAADFEMLISRASVMQAAA